MTTRVDKIIEELGLAQRSLEIERARTRGFERDRICAKTHPDLPLQDHKPASICVLCHDALRGEYAKAALVAGSIHSVVRTWMQSGKECPFCGSCLKHTDTCYLSLDAGRQLLEEYAAIEMHRDMLLADRTRETGVPSPTNGTVHTGLKDRYRARHAHHNGHTASR